ncbi:hypothetical protein B6N60_01131 [Richelia sinica FACHB-800]|uniref:DUF4149 domain-containing protein n=1 Tax=Richelia sinica FACHB-800 TaxID=1357546 RepID=A0A975T6Q3_9NOST|nr:DUF4149 domain-containing protein [Richelia sinica]MBD2664317.1 hypothetical protein [Richelia sinica FACHB-800]QXE22448.1 hypothetical protein B6N60_01131 [Richelia sinica FACHB-800]
MNTISKLEFHRPGWQTAIALTLGLWLSASLLLDWVIMPILYFAGMMNEASFATAGYSIFWNFNRLEILAAATIFTGVLAVSKLQSHWRVSCILLSGLLLTVTFLDTYFLTPQMCALGSHFNLFTAANPVPTSMNLLHSGYFLLETLKLVAGGTLLSWCWREV